MVVSMRSKGMKVFKYPNDFDLISKCAFQKIIIGFGQTEGGGIFKME